MMDSGVTRDRRRKTGKGQLVHRPHAQTRTRPTIQGREPSTPPPPAVDSSTGAGAASDERRYDRNRQGAIAGRGFHYQDAASAWLAARLLDDATYESVVPEGSHEDLTCEGGTSVAFQMKSQLMPAGGIKASLVARHLRDLYSSRTERGYTGSCELVLEHDVAEAPLPDRDALFGDLPSDHPLRQATARVLARAGLPEDAFDDLRVMIVGFDEARSRCAAIVADYFDVPQPVAEHVALRFARMVSDAVDHNAGATFADRRLIDRTALVAMATRTIAETDPTKLTAALDSGACEPARLEIHLQMTTGTSRVSTHSRDTSRPACLHGVSNWSSKCKRVSA